MAKRIYGWTEEKIARYYKEGRGSGELVSYKPWLTIQNVPSSGRVHRIKGWKTSRIHQLLSDLERDYFYLLEWADNVIDIREQYPLQREETLQIAESKDLKHSIDNTTQTPIVFTTDFFITLRHNAEITYIARTIKPSEKLEDARTIEKFEIERAYWQEKNIDWGIVTEKDILQEAAKNVGWLHKYYEPTEEGEYQLIPELYESLQTSQVSISKTLRHFDESYTLESGCALTLFKHLLATKQVLFDVTKRFSMTSSTEVLAFPDPEVCSKRVAE